MSNITKNLKFRAALRLMVKMSVLGGLQNDQNWFQVKSEWQKIPEIHLLYIAKLAAQVCI